MPLALRHFAKVAVSSSLNISQFVFVFASCLFGVVCFVLSFSILFLCVLFVLFFIFYFIYLLFL